MRQAFTCWAVIAMSLLVLAGCRDADLDALQSRLEALRSRPQGDIATLPDMPSHTVAVYHDAGRRSPFEADGDEAVAPVEQASLPDAERPRQPLEAFALDNLELVGTLRVGRISSGLVEAPGEHVYRVFVGDYLGRDYGRIVSIEDRRVSLMETVRDPHGGWMQRPQRLEMAKRETGG